MNKMVITLFIMISVYMLTGCAPLNVNSMKDYITINKGINNPKVKVGAFKDDVVKAIGKKPNPSCIKTKIRMDGSYELWDFTTRSCRTDSSEPYVLIFKGNVLEEIRTSGSLLDTEF
jgi:hypothetical protein